MQLKSYIQGRWFAGEGEAQQLRDATTGQVIASASSTGIDFKATLRYAREVGGPALRQLTFHQRAALLKQLAKKLGEYKDEFYTLSYATGATKTDSWIDIDGGFGTLFAYASRGTRELPNSKVYIDGDLEALSKGGTFVGQHICVPLEGAAVHINAFNFPVWGMLEKLSPTLLAGVPAIVKPATNTAYLTELVVRRIIESGILPEGSLQLICGSVGDLFDHLTCQDVVSFTGSASTAQKLRTHQNIVANSVRFIGETDSINSCVLAEDARPGQPEFDLFVREVVREMTTKAGQKCTAIRKAIVPMAHADAVVEALRASLAKVVVGDPRLDNVRMGPLAALGQRREVLGRISELRREAELITAERVDLAGVDHDLGAFVAPSLLYCREPRKAKALHHIEAFGPVCSVVPYESTSEAIAFARLGEGSLVASVFTADDALATELVLGLAPLHGRLAVINRDCAKESTGHGSPLPALVHGGPGRAGG
ncbi:MAG TPA: phenylacetic acid degradation bifunctional protein PaaZ, partial [Steroidobacter sp.]|nr:phenylacetic acid degradation bifunctional protein PaaZ [Steroidobacter sp.]